MAAMKLLYASRALLACLLLLASAISVSPAVIGVDYGGENLKLALVQPGRTPISCALNEMGKRKSQTSVTFVNGQRLLGEEGAALVGRYPQKVFMKSRETLGRPYDKSVGDIFSGAFLSYNLTADEERGTTVFENDAGQLFSPEEMVANVLHYAKTVGELNAHASVVDALLCVPPFFGLQQKAALINAADLAGLNVMGIITEPTAAGIQYGIDRDFTNGTSHIVVYDMGATSTYAALLKYDTYKGKDAGKSKAINQFQVLQVRWDDTLGGQSFERVLIDHFAEEFNQKLKGEDVRTIPKAIAKLKKEVRKTKEILSANKEAPCNVESLYNDMDFRSKITRTRFEELAAPLFERAMKPITDVLEAGGIKADDLDAFELIGGSTRIPKIKSAIGEFIGRSVDLHLDSDEAILFGAGYKAANLSTTFRMRPFGAADIMPYPINVKLEGATLEDAAEGEEIELVPGSSSIPFKRTLAVPPTRNNLTLTLSYGGDVLPPGLTEKYITTYHISGVDKALARYENGKYNETEFTKVAIKFVMGRDGLLVLEKAEAKVETVEYIPIKPKAKPNTTDTDLAGGNSTSTNSTDETESGAESTPDDAGVADEAIAGENETADEAEDAGAQEDTFESEQEDDATQDTEAKDSEENEDEAEKFKTKKRKFFPDLDVVGGEMQFVDLSREAIRAGKKMIEDYLKSDLAKQEQAEAKNALEAYCISTRSEVRDEDSGLFQVTTEEEREEFADALTDAEDWLYMDGENEPAAVFKAKLKELKKTGDNMYSRLFEFTARPAAVKKARDAFDKIRTTVATWEMSKPHINETQKTDLLDKVKELENWLDSKEEEQASLEATVEPAFTAAELEKKTTSTEKLFLKLKKIPAPKKPKAEQNATDTNSTETNAAEGESEEPAKAEEDLDEPTSDKTAEDKPNEEAVKEEEEHDELK